MAALNMQLSCPPAGPAGPAAAAPGQEIPDLRPQFLATQYRGQPGQVVVLPPLQGDGSLQTIQILTPAHSTQYSANSANSTPYSANSTPYTVQTIVLPIMKLQPTSSQPTPSWLTSTGPIMILGLPGSSRTARLWVWNVV